MVYDLYTFPNCHVCEEIKRYLKEQNMGYNEFSLNGSGRKKFQETYKENKEGIKRDDKGIIVPILIETENSRIAKILQGEEIKNLVDKI